MKKSMTALLVIFFISCAGCLPVLRKPDVSMPKAETRQTPLPTPERIDKKIEILEATLQSEGVSERDKEIASILLELYKTLKGAYSKKLSEAEYRKVITTFFRIFSKLDEKYFTKERIAPDYSGPMSLFSIKRKKIMGTYFAGDFKGVINQCLELKSLFGPEALIPEIGLVFALSLGKEGMTKDAIEIGEGIALEMESMPDILYLRAKIAEWYLKLGEKQEAVNMYDKLTDNLDEKQSILKGLNRRITGKNPPETPSDFKTDVADLSPMDGLLLKVMCFCKNICMMRQDFC